jgi:hypothetical protein
LSWPIGEPKSEGRAGSGALGRAQLAAVVHVHARLRFRGRGPPQAPARVEGGDAPWLDGPRPISRSGGRWTLGDGAPGGAPLP